MTTSPGIARNGVQLRPEVLRGRREEQRAHREAQRASGDVHRHREPAMFATEPVRQRRRGRMKRRAPRPPTISTAASIGMCRRDPDETEDRRPRRPDRP